VDDESIIREQIAYYRARAVEYDDWWERRAEYDIGPEFGRAWEHDVGELRSWLANAGLHGHVLELAAGTGNWTTELLRHVDRVTAVDASPEVLAINRIKNGADRVDYVVADLFDWTPPRRYDAVFFSFWISHVPAARWDGFWDLVKSSLEPGGLVLFCDNAHPEHAGRHGPGDWPVAAKLRQPDTTETEVERRRLRDGSSYTVVKNYWWPGDLTDDLRERGWRVTVDNTSFAFICGQGSYAQEP